MHVHDVLRLHPRVIEYVEHLVTPAANAVMPLVETADRKSGGFRISISSAQSTSGGMPSSLNPSHQRRTASTFSSDIAYSDSPAASRASFGSR
jgi:hypothetical protein